MSLFDDTLLHDDTLSAVAHARSLTRRLNQALQDLGMADPGEDLARASDVGAYVVLRIPTDRADRLIRRAEDLGSAVPL